MLLVLEPLVYCFIRFEHSDKILRPHKAAQGQTSVIEPFLSTKNDEASG